MDDSAALSVVLPTSTRKNIAEYFYGTAKKTTSFSLSAEAKLMPLLADLPPPHVRAMHLAPLDTAALRAFELRPVAADPAAAVAAAAVDIRQRIWELAHQVHDVYTNHWPHTWARPTFAHDAQNPTPEEWMPCADVLLKSSGCKTTLEKWRDAAETAPRTREALSELIDKLGKYAARMRKRREAERQAEQQKGEAQRRQEAQQLGERERALEAQSLHQRHQLAVASLQAELEALNGARSVDYFKVQTKMSEIAAANLAWQKEATELQSKHAASAQAEEAALQAAAAAAQAGSASDGLSAVAAVAQPVAEVPPPRQVKRPRR